MGAGVGGIILSAGAGVGGIILSAGAGSVAAISLALGSGSGGLGNLCGCGLAAKSGSSTHSHSSLASPIWQNHSPVRSTPCSVVCGALDEHAAASKRYVMKHACLMAGYFADWCNICQNAKET